MSVYPTCSFCGDGEPAPDVCGICTDAARAAIKRAINELLDPQHDSADVALKHLRDALRALAP